MKTIKLLALVLTLTLCNSLCAQSNWIDVVYLKNGSIIKGTIIEQVPNESLKIQTADGSVFVHSMSDVEKMSKEEKVTTFGTQYNAENSNKLCALGANDAQANYNGDGSLSGVTWATTLLTSPLIGLIPAAIGASTQVQDHQLNYPNRELWQNTDYKQCYKDEAQQMKKRKAWKALGASSGVWLGATVLLYVLAFSVY